MSNQRPHRIRASKPVGARRGEEGFGAPAMSRGAWTFAHTVWGEPAGARRLVEAVCARPVAAKRVSAAPHRTGGGDSWRVSARSRRPGSRTRTAGASSERTRYLGVPLDPQLILEVGRHAGVAVGLTQWAVAPALS